MMIIIRGKELPKVICKVCGYPWEKRVENPVQCPRCHSPKWREGTKKKQQQGGRKKCKTQQ